MNILVTNVYPKNPNPLLAYPHQGGGGGDSAGKRRQLLASSLTAFSPLGGRKSKGVFAHGGERPVWGSWDQSNNRLLYRGSLTFLTAPAHPPSVRTCLPVGSGDLQCCTLTRGRPGVIPFR